MPRKHRYYNDIELRRTLYHLIKNRMEVKELIKEIKEEDTMGNQTTRKELFRIIDLDENLHHQYSTVMVENLTRTDHVLDKYLFLIELEKENINLVNRYYRSMFNIFTKSGICVPCNLDNDDKYWYIDCKEGRRSGVCISWYYRLLYHIEPDSVKSENG